MENDLYFLNYLKEIIIKNNDFLFFNTNEISIGITKNNLFHFFIFDKHTNIYKFIYKIFNDYKENKYIIENYISFDKKKQMIAKKLYLILDCEKKNKWFYIPNNYYKKNKILIFKEYIDKEFNIKELNFFLKKLDSECEILFINKICFYLFIFDIKKINYNGYCFHFIYNNKNKNLLLNDLYNLNNILYKNFF